MGEKRESEQKEKVVCPSCGTENLLGTLFCAECGTYLPSGGPLRTEPLAEQSGEVEGGKPAPERDGLTQTLNIELEIMKSERQILLSEPVEVLFGRLDAAHGIFPEVDLTAEGGLENGVSRRHARLYTEDGLAFVEDLDSTNGTFLNEDRLTPYVARRVRDNDVLMLGTMKINVHLHRKGSD